MRRARDGRYLLRRHAFAHPELTDGVGGRAISVGVRGKISRHAFARNLALELQARPGTGGRRAAFFCFLTMQSPVNTCRCILHFIRLTWNRLILSC